MQMMMIGSSFTEATGRKTRSQKAMLRSEQEEVDGRAHEAIGKCPRGYLPNAVLKVRKGEARANAWPIG